MGEPHVDHVPVKRKAARFDILACALVFLLTLLVHGLSRNLTSFDSRWVVHTALSILHQGNTDLDEYLPQLERDRFYLVECVSAEHVRSYPVRDREQCRDGHLYHFYPAGLPLLVAPAVWAAEKTLGLAQPWLRPLAEEARSPLLKSFLRGDLVEGHAVLELAIASFFMAVASAVLYLIARQFLGRLRSLLVAAIFAFCTPAWSTASRGLWQHGPSMLMLALALLLAILAEKRPGLIRFLGLPLALSFWIRPTNAVPILVFSVFVLLRHRKHFLSYMLWSAPLAALFVGYSLAIYGTLIPPYYWLYRVAANSLLFHSRLGEALAGNLISPSRGLFLYVPVFVFAVYGMAIRPHDERMRKLRPCLVAIVLLHWILISFFQDWAGGHSFGPRYFSDMTPLLTYFLIPVLKPPGGARFRRTAFYLAFGALVAASFFINCRGATRWESYLWNVRPGEANPARLWDWKDPAFLR